MPNDQKVVSLKFDNKQFNNEGKKSRKVVEDLKGSLDFKEISVGFSDSLEKMVMKMTVLQNLTNKMTDTALGLVKALTIDQVAEGWNKYEKETKSVATILSNTTEDAEKVYNTLEKLNTFTDETSYSYSDMVDTIGKFTAAGVGLDDAVVAMQGISTWAASAGQGTQQAYMAMYNLSQAIGTGQIRLQDWMSIENANMATKQFKELVIDAGLQTHQLLKDVDGVIQTSDGIKVTAENFRSSLSSGWLDTETLMTVLKSYGSFSNELMDILNEVSVDFQISGETTATSWLKAIDAFEKGEDINKIIEDNFGNLEKTEDNINAISSALKHFSQEEYKYGIRAFADAQKARTFTDVIQATKDAVSTGWKGTFRQLLGDSEEVTNFFTDLSNRMYDTFNGSAYDRNEILKDWAEVPIEIGDSTVYARDLLTGAFWDIYDSIESIIIAIKEGIGEAFGIDYTKLQRLTIAIKNFTESLIPAESGLEKIRNIAKNISTIFININKFIKQIIKSAREAFREVFGDADPFLTLFQDITAALAGFSDTLELTGNSYETSKNIFKGIAGVIKIVVMALDSLVKGTGPVSKALRQIIKFVWNLAGTIGKFISELAADIASSKNAGEVFQSIVTFIKKIFGIGTKNDGEKQGKEVGKKVGGFFSSLFESAKEVDISTIGNLLLKIFGAMYNLTLALLELVVVLTDLLASLIKGLAWFLKEIGPGLKKLGQGIKKAIQGIVAWLKETGKNIKMMNDLMDITFTKGLIVVLIVSVAIFVLVAFLLRKSLSLLIMMTKGVIDLTYQFGQFVKSAKQLVRAARFVQIATAIMILAAGVYLIAKAIEALTVIDWSDPSKWTGPVVVIGVVLAIFIAVFAILLKYIENLSRTMENNRQLRSYDRITALIGELSSVIIAIGIAVLAFAVAIRILKDVPTKTILAGGLVLGIIIAIFATMVILVARFSNNMKSSGRSLSLSKKSFGFSDTSSPIWDLTIVILAIGAVAVVLMAALAVIAKTLNDAEMKRMTKVAIILGVFMALFVALVGLIGGFGKRFQNSSFTLQKSKGQFSASGNKGVGATLIEIAIAFGIIAVSMIALAAAAKMIEKLDNPGKSFLIIGGILVILGGVLILITAVMKKLELNAKTMVIFAAALSIIVFSLISVIMSVALISAIGVNPKKLIGYVGSIALLIAVLGAAMVGMMAITKIAKVGGILAASVLLLAFAAVITIFALILPIFEKISWKALAKAGVVILALSAVLVGLAALASIPVIGGGMVLVAGVLLTIASSMLIFSAALLILAIAIKKLSKISAEDIQNIVNALVAFIDNIPVIVDHALEALKQAGLKIVEIMVLTIGYALDALFKRTDKIVTTIFEFLIKVLDTLITYLPQIISKISQILVLLIEGLVDHVNEIAQPLADLIMSVLSVGILLFQSMSLDQFIEASIGILAATTVVTEMIVFVSLAIALILEMQIMAKALVLFGIAITPFLKLMSQFDPAVLVGCAALAEMVMLFTAASMLDGLNRFFGNGLEKSMPRFAEAIKSLGEPLTKFYKETKTVKSDHIKECAEGVKYLAEALTSIPSSGGLLQKLVGEKQIDKFAQCLPILGEGLREFHKSTIGVDKQTVQVATESARMISTFAKGLPKEGGAIQWLTGEIDISKFAKTLPELGKNIKKFSDESNGTSKDIVEIAAKSATAISMIYSTLPRTGGAFQWLTGEPLDLGKFSMYLPDLGTNVKRFSVNARGLDVDVADTAVTVIEAVADIAQTLSENDKWWTNESKSWKKFYALLPDIGTNLNNFAKKTVDINPERMAALGSFLKSLGSFIFDVSGEDGKDAARVIKEVTNSASELTSSINAFGSDSLANDANIENLYNEATMLIQTIQNAFDENPPIIRPILDMSAITENAAMLSARNAGNITQTTNDAVKGISGKSGAASLGERIKEGAMTYATNVVSNYYSPKALNTSEVVRQNKLNAWRYGANSDAEIGGKSATTKVSNPVYNYPSPDPNSLASYTSRR